MVKLFSMFSFPKLIIRKYIIPPETMKILGHPPHFLSIKECANFFRHILTLLYRNDRQIEVINWHICGGPLYIDLSPLR